MYFLYNKHYLSIVNYHSIFQIIKKTEGFSAYSLILACKVISTEYRLFKKIISDTGSNFVSEIFKEFCRNLDIEQAVSSSYHHQSNGQVEACI